MTGGWTHLLVDPLIVQAEKILSQRQARSLVIDADLLGEPGWDILLSAFIASGRNRHCYISQLAKELDLSIPVAKRWVTLLAERDLVEDAGSSITISQRADGLLRQLFGAQLREMMQDLGGADGTLRFSSGGIPEGE